MTPGEQSAAVIRRLAAEVRADRCALRARSAEVRALVEATEPAPLERPAALALALDRTYTTLESILERVGQTLEGGVPTGPAWHRSLLRDSGLEIDRTRPVILGGDGLSAADELLRFRHFLRHAYSAVLDPVRIQAVAAVWIRGCPAVESDLDRFEAFLVELAGRLESAG